jgi:CrcB protein
MLGVVVVGGMIGVALRELLLLPFPPDAGGLVLPAVTMGINVVGSFLLGVVIGRLGDRHPLRRAFVGTGVLGGFTTYSAFAVQAAGLLSAAPVVGVALAAVSVLLGLVAAGLGLRLTQPPRTRGVEAAP